MRWHFRQHKRFLLFVSTSLALIFLLIIFQQTRPVISLSNHLRAAVSSAGNGVGSLIEHIFYSKVELSAENDRLKSQLQALTLNAAGVASLQEENVSLAALLDFVHRTSVRPIVAKVLSRADSINGQAILLDRGSADGLHLGDPVIAGDGHYVGEVTVLHEASAIARLVNDPASKVGAQILNQQGTIGITEGQNGELLRIDFIPQSVDLNVNDLVVTSGLDPGVPSGLVLGTVQQVLRDEHDPFQQALVQPVTDLHRLSVVGILDLGSL